MQEPCPKPENKRERYEVHGVVQGVGFRPFVFRLAAEENLAGFIGNDTGGATIEVEGPAVRVEAFRQRLEAEAPPLARIDSVSSREIPVTGEAGFRIVASDAAGHVSTGIPADAATCADCLAELFDPNDRRYRYPFLNCTNCGPRYTITRRIPYDRPQTSMAKFKMCAACQAEYDDPANRRYHAQPNACAVCGPRAWIVAPKDAPPTASHGEAGQEVSGCGPDSCGRTHHAEHEVSGRDFSRADLNPRSEGALAPAQRSPIDEAIDRLMAGEVMAVKGIGGFHLAVDATNEAAVTRLRERKHRYGKPLAVMVRDLDAARELCELSPEEEVLLQKVTRPIVLARRHKECGIAPSVAPGIPWLGVFLPYAPLQHLLFADERVKALVMTSANLSEEPIAIDNDEALARLGKIADAFLMHDREILQRCDDSVMALVDGAPQLIRRARGFVPLAVPLPPNADAPPLLAVGGHLKNAFALARGQFVYQSQHLGDFENVTGLDFFREALAHLMHTFEIEPVAVAHDLHPGYLSTSWAKEWAGERKLPLIAVQHHHAHIAACMAEHGLEGPVLGLSLDGTGYGTDGKIWGGEVLIARLYSFKRFAHLQPIPLPGGDTAVKEPWRVAFAALREAGIEPEEAARLTGAEPEQARVVERMIERKLNAPMTSSLGRLFDAVAAVVLGRRVVDYEAQAAIELEGCAEREDDDIGREEYRLELWEGEKPGGPNVLRTNRMWKVLLSDLRCGEDASRVAARFHSGVAEGLINAAANARIETGINRVMLSGGCLHNRRLARLLRVGLEEEGFQVYQHRNVSPGDGGLSYGQAVVAAAILAKKRAEPGAARKDHANLA